MRSETTNLGEQAAVRRDAKRRVAELQAARDVLRQDAADDAYIAAELRVVVSQIAAAKAALAETEVNSWTG